MKNRAAAAAMKVSDTTRIIRRIRMLLAMVVLLVYGQTVSFDFTLDDDSVYVKNELVQKGVTNVGRIFSESSLGAGSVNTINHPYRPFTMLTFALDKSLFGASQMGAHLINLLLYLVLIQVLFSLLRRLFPDRSLLLTGGIALLFAVHPVHTEVVASIKSRDEILAALFGFLAWFHFLSGSNKPATFRNQWLPPFFLLLALFSKESSIVFVALLPMSSWMLERSKPASLVRPVLALLVPAIIFLVSRHLVISQEATTVVMRDLDNILFSAGNLNEGIATRFVILFRYLKLLVVPWPLVWDYSYHQLPLNHLSEFLPWLGAGVYAVLIGVALFFIKKQPALAFGILLFLIALTPVSNLFFINATPIGERLLFVPSLGFCMAVALLLINRIPGKSAKLFQKLPAVLFIVTTSLFSILSMKGAANWKDNMTLFNHGVEISPNSARTHFNLGVEYWKEAQRSSDSTNVSAFADKAIVELRKSLDIYPDQFMAMTDLGCLYDLKGNYDSSRTCFEKSIVMYSDQPVVLTNLSNILNKRASQLEIAGKQDEAIRLYRESSDYDRLNLIPLRNLGLLYARRQVYDSAFIYFNAALGINSEDRSTLENYAVSAFLAKNYDQAIRLAQKHILLYGYTRPMLGVLSDANYAKGNYDEVMRLRKLLEPGR